MKSLIVGRGQVGQGLYEVIKDFHETHIKDVEDLDLDGVEVLHLCFPFSDKFVDIANGYIEKYKPKLTINHASVAIGTTEKLKGLVCYSPIRGKHPDLAKGIKTFDKFVAGSDEALKIASQYFGDCKLSYYALNGTSKMRTLEFCKLMANIRYGYEICFMQEVERICKKFGLDSEVFKTFEVSYNIGYHELGEENMVRPILFGGLIGGHCVIQNCEILQEQYPSELLDWILFSNTKKKGELQ